MQALYCMPPERERMSVFEKRGHLDSIRRYIALLKCGMDSTESELYYKQRLDGLLYGRVERYSFEDVRELAEQGDLTACIDVGARLFAGLEHPVDKALAQTYFTRVLDPSSRASIDTKSLVCGLLCHLQFHDLTVDANYDTLRRALAFADTGILNYGERRAYRDLAHIIAPRRTEFRQFARFWDFYDYKLPPSQLENFLKGIMSRTGNIPRSAFFFVSVYLHANNKLNVQGGGCCPTKDKPRYCSTACQSAHWREHKRVDGCSRHKVDVSKTERGIAKSERGPTKEETEKALEEARQAAEAAAQAKQVADALIAEIEAEAASKKPKIKKVKAKKVQENVNDPMTNPSTEQSTISVKSSEETPLQNQPTSISLSKDNRPSHLTSIESAPVHITDDAFTSSSEWTTIEKRPKAKTQLSRDVNINARASQMQAEKVPKFQQNQRAEKKAPNSAAFETSSPIQKPSSSATLTSLTTGQPAELPVSSPSSSSEETFSSRHSDTSSATSVEWPSLSSSALLTCPRNTITFGSLAFEMNGSDLVGAEFTVPEDSAAPTRTVNGGNEQQECGEVDYDEDAEEEEVSAFAKLGFAVEFHSIPVALDSDDVFNAVALQRTRRRTQSTSIF